MRYSSPIVAVLLCGASALPAQQPDTWFANGSAIADFTITRDSTVAHSGRFSARVSATDVPAGFAGVMTSATRLVAGRYRASAFVRTEALRGGGAALWLRADGAAGQQLRFASTRGDIYLGRTMPWTRVELELDVPAETRYLVYGVLSMGQGTLWVDDVRVGRVDAVADTVRTQDFESEGALRLPATPPPAAAVGAASPREGPRPVSGQALENLVAFTRLVGYVRFFYPGDEALTTNWDEFTIRGVRAVERAPTADSLAATLRALFAGTAGIVRIASTRLGLEPRSTSIADSAAHGVMFWQHCGIGISARNVYSSQRRVVLARNGGIPTTVTAEACRGTQMPVPRVSEPFTVALEGGVTAEIPLALLASAGAADRSWQPSASTERFSAADRATRLGAVALAWITMQHFYPYFDLVRTDWPGALRAALSAAATDSTPEQFDATLDRMIAALHDGHGNVVRANRTLAALPLQLRMVDGRVIVTATGDSAERAGIRVGDEVLRIDGVPVATALSEWRERTSGATLQWIEVATVAQLGRGEPGSIAELQVRSGDSPRERPRITRVARVMGANVQEKRPAPVAELRPGILYVDLDRVTDAMIDSAMPRLVAATGIVFDMRGYPRSVKTAELFAHLGDSVMRSARFQMPLVVRPDHQDLRFAGDGWTIYPRAPRIRAKLVFLAGGRSISYAESTLGVVEENRLGAIVGETTAGTNGNVNPFALPGGYTVYWTGMRVTKHDGSPHHGVGIRPTVEVRPTVRGIREGRDEVLERALALLTSGVR